MATTLMTNDEYFGEQMLGTRDEFRATLMVNFREWYRDYDGEMSFDEYVENALDEHLTEADADEIKNCEHLNAPVPSKIKDSRKSAGLTQEQAARVIGATRRAWQEWEGGRRNMPGAKWELFVLKTRHLAEAAERKRMIVEAVNEFFGDSRRVWATPGTDNHSANFYGDTWLCPLSRRDVVNLIDIAAIEWTWPGEDYPQDQYDVLTGKAATEAAIDAVLDDLQFEKPQE